MSPSEFALLFEGDDIGCGYNGFTLIKLYFNAKLVSEEYSVDSIIDLLNHEVLHSVLGSRVNGKTSSMLDNVQKTIGLRICWWHPKEQRLISLINC